MAGRIEIQNANGATLTLENSDTNTEATVMNPLQTAYTIETVNDFATVPKGFKTVIVKDPNRGGTFTWSESGTANDGTVFAGSVGYWNRQYEGAVNVKWFGDTSGDIGVLINHAKDVSNNITLDNGTYNQTTQVVFDQSYFQFNGNMSNIIVDASLLNPFIIGGSNVTRLTIKNFTVSRNVYNGTTENTGIVYKEFNQSIIENIESRLSKYNHQWSPDTAGSAYNTYINIQGIGGFYNFRFYASETGFANENVFIGGRGVVTSDTDTNLMIGSNGSQSSHNRFLGMSLEGAARAIYCDQSSNYFEFPRTEGATIDCEFGTTSEYNMIISSRYDLDVSDSGNRNQYITYGSGSKFTTGNNDTTTLQVDRIGANTGNTPSVLINDTYSSSGNSYCIETRHGRESDTSYVFRAVRNSDGLVRSKLTTNGKLEVAIQLRSQQSSWNFQPLSLGSYSLWVTSSGKLMIKNGIPTSETDGTIVGTQS
jgi:hypothetical protein